MAQLFKNFARARIASSIGSSDTTIVLQAGYGAIFPEANMGTGSTGDWFKAVLQKVTGEMEIVAVRTRTSGSDVFANVLRAQEGTTALSFDADTVIGCRLTAADVSTLMAPRVLVTGDTMTGPLEVPANAIGAQAPQAQETVRVVGGAAAIPTWATAGRPASPSAGHTGFNTDLARKETWDGTYWVPDGWIELGTFVTTTGTSITFTGIPSYINELVILPAGISQSSTGHHRIRLGTSGGLVTTGYVGTRQYINMSAGTTGAANTDGFYMHSNATAVTLSGQVNLKKYGTTWFAMGLMADTGGGAGTVNVAGRLPLGGTLTQIEIAVTTGAFDAGSISLIGRA